MYLFPISIIACHNVCWWFLSAVGSCDLHKMHRWSAPEVNNLDINLTQLCLWFIVCDDYSIVVPALVISCNDFHCFDQPIERPMPNVCFLCNMVAS